MMTSHPYIACTLTVLCILCGMPLSVQAESPGDVQTTSPEHVHALPGGMRLGVHVLWGDASHQDQSHRVWGIGMMGEHALLHHRLELEWAGHLSRTHVDTEFTETLSLRLPWHVSVHTELFVGVGGMLRQHTQGDLWSAGVLASTGGLYWLDEQFHWGVTFELDMVGDVTRSSREVEGLAGVLYRFGGGAAH